MLPPGSVILQLVPALDAGGVERTAVDMAAAVTAAGGVALVASAGGRLEPELAAAGGELVRLPLDSKDPLTLWRNAGRLERLIGERGVSLVHARSRAPAWSGLRAARRAGAPFVTTYAGAYNAGSAPKRLYNSVMARGDVVIANSDFTRERLLREHGTDPERVVVIPRGTDLARFDPAAVDPSRLAAARVRLDLGAFEPRLAFLLAARLTRWKGQALLIEALARSGLDAVVVLAGDPQGREDYRAELQGLAHDRGLEDRVRVVGHLDDMPAAYAACDFACVPSVEPEAFGRGAVEPQAMHRPVLAAAHGAPVETVLDGETGWLVPASDPDAWAAALRRAAALTPYDRARMGEAGRANALRFGLPQMTDATLAVYARLLEARGETAREEAPA